MRTKLVTKVADNPVMAKSRKIRVSYWSRNWRNSRVESQMLRLNVIMAARGSENPAPLPTLKLPAAYTSYGLRYFRVSI